MQGIFEGSILDIKTIKKDDVDKFQMKFDIHRVISNLISLETKLCASNLPICTFIFRY